MRRKEIERLQSIQGFPALTITLPTYTVAPEVQQNPIRLKNLVNEAKTLLDAHNGELNGAGDVLLSRLTEVVDGLETTDFQEGLAIFVHAEFAGAYPVPFALPERVVLDDSFLTRDVVRARLQRVRYWVVTLSDNARVFVGSNEKVEKRDESDMPVNDRERSEDPSIPGARESGHESLVDEENRQFNRRVDDRLTALLQEEELPVVVLGVTRNLAFFREVTANEKAIAGTAEGNYDHASADEIAAVAWEALQPYLEQQQSANDEQWENAVSAGLFITGIEAIWEAAFDGRGDVLLVQDGYEVAGRVDESGRQLTLVEATETSDTEEDTSDVRYDAVDDLIELVLSRVGRVRL
jgi:hypothetical protein